MHNDTGFLLDQMWGLDYHGRYLSRELSGITTPHFAYGVQLWVNSLIPLTGKQYKMKEHREKSPIPFFLQTSLSLSYLLHNSMLKELFGKALCKNNKQEARRKNKLNRKKWKKIDRRDGCLNQDKQERRRKLWTGKIRRGIHRMADVPSPPLCPTRDKKTGKCGKCPPHPSPPPRKARNAIADSTLYHDWSKI